MKKKAPVKDNVKKPLKRARRRPVKRKPKLKVDKEMFEACKKYSKEIIEIFPEHKDARLVLNTLIMSSAAACLAADFDATDFCLAFAACYAEMKGQTEGKA